MEFNVSGFYSHLPIQKGDRIGAILCARVKNEPDNLAMYPFASGIVPVAAPFYGTYEGETSFSYHINYNTYLATQSGMSVTDYQNSIKSNLTAFSVKNDANEDYINAISKLIPREDELDLPVISENASEIEIKAKTDVVDWARKILDDARHATFVMLYEHEKVLKRLVDTGRGMQLVSTSSNGGEIFTLEYVYDRFVECMDKIDGILGQKTGLLFRSETKSLELLDGTNDPEVIKEFTNTLMLRNRAYIAFDALRHPMFLRLYRNAAMIPDFLDKIGGTWDILNYKDLKPYFIEAIYLYMGMMRMNGVFMESCYSGQDANALDHEFMNKVCAEIISDIRYKQRKQNGI